MNLIFLDYPTCLKFALVLGKLKVMHDAIGILMWPWMRMYDHAGLEKRRGISANV